MGERIIMVFCCLPCAATFTILGIAAWRKKTPVHFWTGTNVTADEVTDVRAYNRANAKMWFAYSFPYWLAAAISFQNALLAGVILGVSATFGTLGIVVWYMLRIEKRYKWKYVQFHQSLQAEQEKREKFLRTKTKLEKYLDILSAVLMIGTVLWVAVMWRFLPERIPRHYNAMGKQMRGVEKGCSSLIL